MEHDDRLRRTLLRRVRAFFFAGAGLSQAVWDRLDAIAERSIGRRVPMFTGLGMTETSPVSTLALQPGIGAGHIGLPCPGVEIKLVPAGDKIEIRIRGQHVMPGYWRAPELSREAFDAEGFYRTGDAVKLVDPREPQRGLLFDGRLAEDFKLSTGTFVSVGPLRVRVITAGAPYVQDVVVAAPDRDEIGLLLIPCMDELRRLAAASEPIEAARVLVAPSVREWLQALLDRLSEAATGSANRPVWAHWLADPPSIDRGEITDKGSINQRAVLAEHAGLIEKIYAGTLEVVRARAANP